MVLSIEVKVVKVVNCRNSLSDEGPTLETLDFTIHIGSTPTVLYFDLYLNTAQQLIIDVYSLGLHQSEMSKFN